MKSRLNLYRNTSKHSVDFIKKRINNMLGTVNLTESSKNRGLHNKIDDPRAKKYAEIKLNT